MTVGVVCETLDELDAVELRRVVERVRDDDLRVLETTEVFTGERGCRWGARPVVAGTVVAARCAAKRTLDGEAAMDGAAPVLPKLPNWLTTMATASAIPPPTPIRRTLWSDRSRSGR